jgi:phosphotransferase system IIB component
MSLALISPVAATFAATRGRRHGSRSGDQTRGKLEKTVSALIGLPGEVSQLSRRVGTLESQMVQLRTEMKDESSAVRHELAETRDNLLGVIESGGQATLRLLAEVREETNARFDGLSRQMRVLHEDVIERISRLGGR